MSAYMHQQTLFQKTKIVISNEIKLSYVLFSIGTINIKCTDNKHIYKYFLFPYMLNPDIYKY